MMVNTAGAYRWQAGVIALGPDGLARTLAKLACTTVLSRGGRDPAGAGPAATGPDLSFEALAAWWAMLGLNQRPLACEASALPLS